MKVRAWYYDLTPERRYAHLADNDNGECVTCWLCWVCAADAGENVKFAAYDPAHPDVCWVCDDEFALEPLGTA